MAQRTLARYLTEEQRNKGVITGDVLVSPTQGYQLTFAAHLIYPSGKVRELDFKFDRQ